MWAAIQGWFAANWWVVLLIVLGAWVAIRIGAMVIDIVIRRTVRHRAHGDTSQEDIKKRQDTLVAMTDAIWRVLVWLVAGFSILRLFLTLDLTPLFAGASVLGVALGFGAQTLIKDFISGLFIILENQYRVGDVVEIEGSTGTVEQITLRSTILRDNNGSVHYIPNGNISSAINKTMGFAKVNLSMEVPATTDIDKLSEVINRIGTKMAEEEKWQKRIIDPPHFLGIDSFNTTSLELKIVGKTQPTAQWSITGELRRRLLTELKKEGIISVKIPSSDKDKKK
jgi:small conductance mechanosensitive channel